LWITTEIEETALKLSLLLPKLDSSRPLLLAIMASLSVLALSAEAPRAAQDPARGRDEVKTPAEAPRNEAHRDHRLDCSPEEAAGPGAEAAAGAPADETTIARVHFDLKEAPSIGPETAPVTLVEFIDYQCPFCARAHATVEQLVAKYAGKLRVLFVQNPLSFHADAALAAQAALAAADQGRFRSLHNLLLVSPTRLKPQDLVLHASQAGLDATAMEVALSSGAFVPKVQADIAIAERIGVTATPYFFVNGRPIRGAQAQAAFEKVIDEELSGSLKPTRWIPRVGAPRPSAAAAARTAAAPAPPADSAHAEILKQLTEIQKELKILRGELGQLRRSVAELTKGAPARPEPAPKADPPVPAKISLDGDRVLGSREARVAIIEFSDYQCGFCRRFHAGTLPSLKKAYIDTGKVQYVFRDYPLKFHTLAKGASVAANCAGRQGAYWEMQEALFREQARLGPDLYRELAASLHLDAKAFEACLGEPIEAKEVDDDFDSGSHAGVRGTPTFFVGRVDGESLVDLKRLVGAQTFEVFSKTIDSFLNVASNAR